MTQSEGAAVRDPGIDPPMPSGLRRVARNSALLIFMRVGMPAASFLLVYAISHSLGAEGFGRYSLAFGILAFFNTVTPLGLGAIVTREGARDQRTLTASLPNAMMLGLVASLPMMAIMALLGPALRYDDATTMALQVLCLVIFPYTAASFFESAFIALQRVEYVAICMTIDYAVKIGGGLLALYRGWGLEWILAMAVLSQVCSCIAAAYFLRRAGVHLSWRPDAPTTRRLLAQAPTFMLISIFATLYWRVDMYMLSKLQPMEQVGLYASAYRIFDMAIVLPSSLCLAVYPHMISLMSGNGVELRGLGRRMARYFMAIGLPMGVCSLIVGGDVLALLFGEPFRAAGATLSVLMWTFFLYGYVRYNAYLLIASNRQKVDLAFNVLMLIINILLNLILIPRLGHLGAALSTLVAIVIYGLVQHAYLGRSLPRFAARMRADRFTLIATACCAMLVLALRTASTIVAVSGGIAIYALVLLWLGFFSREELRMMRLDRFRFLIDRVRLPEEE
jgi:O-antigen/teichoic acid export membrane protein